MHMHERRKHCNAPLHRLERRTNVAPEPMSIYLRGLPLAFRPVFRPDAFFGTLRPAARASERPIAIACLRLLTFRPERPLFNVPALRFFITRRTVLCVFLEYLRVLRAIHFLLLEGIRIVCNESNRRPVRRFQPASCTDARIPAAQIAPGFCKITSLSTEEGAGNAGCPSAPAALCARLESTQVSHHRFAETIRHSLRDDFNGFLRALPGDRAFLSPSPVQCVSIVTKLTPASRRQDHTTSPSANRTARRAIQFAAIASRAPRS
jgi:hypothetical protein